MTETIVEHAHRFLRGHSTGELRFDEHMRTLKYVVAPDGRLVAPAMVAMLQSVDTVLFVPECADGAMEVQVTLEPLDERGPDGGLTDRWRIYHGDPTDVNWAYFDVDGVRHDNQVIDGEGVQRPNPLAEAESGLCRWMNQEHADALPTLCAHFAQINVEDAVMVGIDPDGIDVRGTFTVIRVPATESMQTADEAKTVLDGMMAAAAG